MFPCLVSAFYVQGVLPKKSFNPIPDGGWGGGGVDCACCLEKKLQQF